MASKIETNKKILPETNSAIEKVDEELKKLAAQEIAAIRADETQKIQKSELTGGKFSESFINQQMKKRYETGAVYDKKGREGRWPKSPKLVEEKGDINKSDGDELLETQLDIKLSNHYVIKEPEKKESIWEKFKNMFFKSDSGK